MMHAYIYNADIYCAKCGREIQQTLGTSCDTGDSNDFPQGPYADGGGEADCPHHCGGCRLFLENPLTEDGYSYVREAVESATGDSEVLQAWAEFYDIGTDTE